MSKNNTPFVSIIIINYNGRKFIGNCLTSLSKISYPKDSYEIIVVDNNSLDDSVSFISKHFPEVTLIKSKENLGFTGGNNLAVQHASGELIALLNSDTTVDPEWLTSMVETISSPNIGIVTSKLRLATPFLDVKISTSVVTRADFERSTDFSPLGIMVENIVCRTEEMSALVWYQSGFYPKTQDAVTIRWTDGEGLALLPCEIDEEEYIITVHGYPTPQLLSTPLTITIGDRNYVKDTIQSNEVKQYTISVKKSDHIRDLHYLIQNAGSVVLSDGHAKDSGSILRKDGKEYLEFYDHDSEYYNTSRKVLAMCGASCLIKKEVIDEIEFLDGHFFMYYEDVDFSLRAWKMGWDIIYQPKSVVYHIHRASTGKDESAFFIHMIERNHLSLVFTHFPLIIFVIEVIIFMIRLMVTLCMMYIYQFIDNVSRYHVWQVRAEARQNTFRFLVSNFFRIYKNRKYWIEHQKRDYNQMQKYLY